MKQFNAVNWNTPDNDYVLMFWEQNIKQFWIDTEYTPSRDIDSWKSLSEPMKLAYMRALGGLTLLDTEQGTVGMPLITGVIDSLQNKAVLSYMGMMENIHAKSYSTIFTTVATTEQINSIFDWVSNQPHLQYKAQVIDHYYTCLIKPGLSPDNYHMVDEEAIEISRKIEIYKALVASVCLESFLFYSGFFLPLWLAGQGQMVASSDIIKKIIEDESIHGLFIGMIAQGLVREIETLLNKRGGPDIIDDLKKFPIELISDLMENEVKYTEEVYTEIGLTAEVKEYLKYNANKALQNLGLEPIYENVQVNPMIINGLNTETKQHDFFSKKSTNYEKPTEVIHLRNEDFNMDASVDI